jgi:hypothetical protein
MVTNEVGEPLGIETLYDDEPGFDFRDDDYLTDDDDGDWDEDDEPDTTEDGFPHETDLGDEWN